MGTAEGAVYRQGGEVPLDFRERLVHLLTIQADSELASSPALARGLR